VLLERDGERLIVVGEVVGAHGVRGELRVRLFNPDSTAIADVADVFLAGEEEGWRPVRSARPHKNVWLVVVGGVESMDAAEALVGRRVAVRERDLPPLAEREFYHHELIGLDVVTESGERVGRVREVWSTGGNDVLAVDDGGRERLVPMIEDVVRHVDVAGGRIVIHVITGLFD
jgi:16S rRNA processing protein RimM